MQQPSTQNGILSFKPINAQISLDINQLYKKAPYIILNNNDIQAKTSISYGGGQSHSWKETIELSASSADRILIEIRDQNSPDESDIIAVGELVVSKVTLLGGNYQDNLPLYFEGKQVGTLLAVCHFKSLETPSQQEQQPVEQVEKIDEIEIAKLEIAKPQREIESTKLQQETTNVQTPIEQQVYQAPNQTMKQQPQVIPQQKPQQQPQVIPQQQQQQFQQQQQHQHHQQQQQPQQFIPQQNVQQNPFQAYQQKQQQMQFQQQQPQFRQVQFQQQPTFQEKAQQSFTNFKQNLNHGINTIQTTFKQPQPQTVQVTYQQPQTIVTLQPQLTTYIPQQTIQVTTIKPTTAFVQPVSYISSQPTIIQTGYVQPTIIQQPIIQPTYIQTSFGHHHHGQHHHGHHGHHH